MTNETRATYHKRSAWNEMLNGKIVSRFISNDQRAAERIISDRRKDGWMYYLEYAGPEPIPYRT